MIKKTQFPIYIYIYIHLLYYMCLYIYRMSAKLMGFCFGLRKKVQQEETVK